MKIRLQLKNEITSHLALTLIYFLLISILRWKFDFDLIGLWFGAIIGTFLLDIDHLLYWYILQPQVPDSLQAKTLIKNKDYRGVYNLLLEVHQTHTRMIFHTAVIQIVLLILAFFILSSVGSVFASALILSINLHLLKDIWQDFLTRGKQAVINWFFWQIKEVPLEKYFNLYLAGVTILFFVLTSLII